MTKDTLLRFAQRARQDSFFLGALLETYQQCHDCGEAALAKYLECDVQDILRLAACRAPSRLAKSFKADVTSIAKYAGCNPDKLALLLREVRSTAALRDESAENTGTGFMLAARDRENDSAPIENTSDGTELDRT